MTSLPIMKQVASLRRELERLLNEDEASLKAALLGTETDTLAGEAGLTPARFINTELAFLTGSCQELQRRLWIWNPSWAGISAAGFGAPPQQAPGEEGEENVARCSFCGKSREQVERLIFHRDSVSICNECVDLCQEILHALPRR